MAATLELKYFNAFWLKKMDSIVDVLSTESATDGITSVGSTTITLLLPNAFIGVGQSFSYVIDGETFYNTILYYDDVTSIITTVDAVPVEIPENTIIQFGEITDFTHIPAAYDSGPNDWYVEEARIRGGYNNTSVDFGVKAYIAEDYPTQQHRINSMIYSGIFNSRTGINNTNQFPVGNDIVRSADPSQGSIQRLYAEDTNLIIFQERKVSRALIDKDAIYSAEGQPMTTSGAQVIGQIQSYAGNYGIATNPESFAVYGYRKYFTDRNQNVVLRLSQDGIEEISGYGMLDFFRDNLAAVGRTGKIVGGWDQHNKQYVVSMQPSNTSNFQTLAFDEDVRGWVSRYSYKPNFSASLRNNFYTFKEGNIWQHYADPTSTITPYGNFYGDQYNSNVTLVLNPNVSLSKNFNTINYEGTTGWQMTEFYTNSDTVAPISIATNAANLFDLEAQLFLNNFKRKENKYFANLINTTPSTYGEIVYGQAMSGAKGFYATTTFMFDNTPTVNPISRSQQYPKAELFSVSGEYVESSY
jgi:hypothetical protein